MRWISFLTPVRCMEARQAEPYIKGHRQDNYTLLDVRQPFETEMMHLNRMGQLLEKRLAGNAAKRD